MKDIDHIGFIINLQQIIEKYSSQFETNSDTAEAYAEFLESLEYYRMIYSDKYISDFIISIQDTFYVKNRNLIRSDAAKRILAILDSNSFFEKKVYFWNSYYSTISIFLKKNPFRRLGVKLLNDKNLFYLEFNLKDKNIESTNQILLNRDLFIGDILDLSDHDLATFAQENFKTLFFKVTNRRYCAEYDEMTLYLEPYFK